MTHERQKYFLFPTVMQLNIAILKGCKNLLNANRCSKYVLTFHL